MKSYKKKSEVSRSCTRMGDLDQGFSQVRNKWAIEGERFHFGIYSISHNLIRLAKQDHLIEKEHKGCM